MPSVVCMCMTKMYKEITCNPSPTGWIARAQNFKMFCLNIASDNFYLNLD